MSARGMHVRAAGSERIRGTAHPKQLGALVSGAAITALERELATLRGQLVSQEPLRMLGALAAGVGHDLANLMGALKMRAHLLDPPAGSTVDRRENAAAIVRIVDQGIAMTTRLRDLVRRKPTRHAPFDLRELVADTISVTGSGLRLGDPAEDQPPSHIVSHVPQLPPALGDRGDAHRALLNVLLNAHQAMGPRGTIRVHGFRRARTVAVVVDDDGPGIPTAQLPLVFEPFFSTKGESGTGLGLAVARAMMEAMGGSISARNRKGGGARIELRFRRDEGPVP